MALLPSTHKDGLTPTRGIAKFAPRNVNGTLQSQIQMSPSAEMTFAQEPNSISYTSQESGLGVILDTTVLGVPRTISVTCNRLVAEIKALFFIATSTDVAQASAMPTGEVTPYVFPNRSIQLGGTANNGAGVFGVSAETIESYEGANAADHVVSTTYAVGAVVVPATPNDHWYMAVAITTGTSGGSAPTWPTNGATVVDSGVTWQDMGLIEYVGGTDYELDGDYGVLNIPTTGAIATAFNRVPAALRAQGISFRLEAGYTRAAKTVPQLATKEDANVEGEFWFYEQNPKGENNVWYVPSATLAPTGDFAGKSGDEYGAMEFVITPQKLPTKAAMYQNGVPLS
jgi:hypothetical protein